MSHFAACILPVITKENLMSQMFKFVCVVSGMLVLALMCFAADTTITPMPPADSKPKMKSAAPVKKTPLVLQTSTRLLVDTIEEHITIKWRSAADNKHAFSVPVRYKLYLDLSEIRFDSEPGGEFIWVTTPELAVEYVQLSDHALYSITGWVYTTEFGGLDALERSGCAVDVINAATVRGNELKISARRKAERLTAQYAVEERAAALPKAFLIVHE